MEKIKGIPYPIEKNPRGLFISSDNVSQIKASMLAIILTIPGERIMEPTFGCALNTIDPKSPDELIVEEGRQKVAKALKRWEKRVQVEDVQTVVIHNENGGKDLNIQVLFIEPSNLKIMHQLTLQVPLGR